MFKFAWLTDIHLDHLDAPSLQAFFIDNKPKGRYDGYFITGDLSTGRDVVSCLNSMVDTWKKPVYFVLGNHDYWNSSFDSVSRRVVAACDGKKNLHWLTASNFFKLSKDCCVVGHDGWYDGVNGNALGSTFRMADWFKTQEYMKITWGNPVLADVYRRDIIELSQKLASKAVSEMKKSLKTAISGGFKRIIVLTHFPPWKDAHIHNGFVGDEHAQPWFTCRMMGEMLEETAAANVGIQFEVLCGHTHGRCEYEVAPNLICRVGAADYGKPVVQEVIEV